MQRLSNILLLTLSLAFLFSRQSPAETAKAENESAQSAKQKPEELLRQMSDYLGNLPAFACRLEGSLDIKAEKEEPMQQVTKMTVRLERPNKLSLIVDEGKLGLTVMSDGKQLTQYLPVLKRYTVSEAPSDYASMTDVGVPLKPTILGTQGPLIPTGGDEYYKRLVAGIDSSKFSPAEAVGGILCYHLQFVEKRFDWDIWIENGKRPVVDKIVVDLSKQFADEKATIKYTVKFSDWNVAPKFSPADFTFKPPATAERVDELIEPEPTRALLGKPAPPFKTVDLDGHPFDLKSHLGKNVILLDFWSTSCGPCVMLMPELEAVAEKFADRGFVYRAVNLGEDPASIKDFQAATKIKAPVVLDREGEIARPYRVENIPQTVLIGKDGTVQVVHLGYNEVLAGEISKEIEALLAGKNLAADELAKHKKRNKQPK